MDELIFSARGLTCRYPHADRDALADVDFDLRSGELVAVVGPNGSGKSTLARALLGIMRPVAGTVIVAGRPGHTWKRREFARLAGVVTQQEEPHFPLRVRQAVMLGRYPRSSSGSLGPHDEQAVASALEKCDVLSLADRWTGTLSGGEWQRVRIARALAQEPRALVLDEPTASLDIRHEMEVFQLIRELARGSGLAAMVITHHVNLAARFADRMVVLYRGRVRADGSPDMVMREELLREVFEWPLVVTRLEGAPQLVPVDQPRRYS